MPNKTIDMIKIRQILRLHASGRGTKYISHTTGTARNTVKKYLQRYASLRVTMEELDGMSDAQLSLVFLDGPAVPSPGKHSEGLEALLPGFAAMLKKRGVTKAMAYQKYQQHPDGYRISSFKNKLNAYMSLGKPSMKMEHRAGDKLFVDFTGKKLQLVDRQTGEVRESEVFVAILGCSQLIFVMAVATQQKGVLSWPAKGPCIFTAACRWPSCPTTCAPP